MKKQHHPITVTIGVLAASAFVLAGCSSGSKGEDGDAALDVPFGATTPAASGPLESVTWMLGGEPTTLDADIDAT
ncbi:hypothetical protein, partial [Acinetobacter baumannii]